MKRLTAILFLFLLSLSATAQLEVKPDSFMEVVGFVNINNDIMTDDNNVPYAVVKVKTENINDKQRRELLFEGDAATFIECEYKIGEVWVYITYKASYLKISHPDLSSTEFWFPFDMEPKKGYEMTLVNKAKMSEDELVERMRKLEEALQNQQNQQIQQEPQTVIVEESAKLRTPVFTFVTLNGSVNTYSEVAFGVTVGMMRKAGVFISLTTNFDLKNFGKEGNMIHNSSNQIQSLIDENGYSHKTSYMSYSAIIGTIIKIYGPINIKIGGGYSSNSMIVNLSNGYLRQNYWVSDVSSYGFGGLLGVQARLGNFVISLDGATTNFNIYECRIGIGYGFGKRTK